MPSYKANHMVKKQLGATMAMLYPNLCYNEFYHMTLLLGVI